MTELSCRDCRFGEPIPGDGGLTRCGWLDRTQDEAGDRMPRWAWKGLMAWKRLMMHGLDSDAYATVHDDAAADCPAFEARPWNEGREL